MGIAEHDLTFRVWEILRACPVDGPRLVALTLGERLVSFCPDCQTAIRALSDDGTRHPELTEADAAILESRASSALQEIHDAPSPETDVPEAVRRELFAAAIDTEISFYWLCAIYRQGYADGVALRRSRD